MRRRCHSLVHQVVVVTDWFPKKQRCNVKQSLVIFDLLSCRSPKNAMATRRTENPGTHVHPKHHNKYSRRKNAPFIPLAPGTPIETLMFFFTDTKVVLVVRCGYAPASLYRHAIPKGRKRPNNHATKNRNPRFCGTSRKDTCNPNPKAK